MVMSNFIPMHCYFSFNALNNDAYYKDINSNALLVYFYYIANYAHHKQCNPNASHKYAYHKQCNPNALHNYAYHKQCNPNALHNYAYRKEFNSQCIANLFPIVQLC